MEIYNEKGQKLVLKDKNQIARGGQGAIYLLEEDPQTVAKIYFDPKQSPGPEKIKILQQLNTQYFVCPQNQLFDENKQIIGYQMIYLPNTVYFPLSQLANRNFCKQNIIDNHFKKDIFTSIYTQINYAHKLQVIIGDLSPYNILFSLDKKVKFIDTDAFQTPLEAHSGILFDEIRDYQKMGVVNQDSDAFAFAVLFFQSITFAHPFKGVHKLYHTIKERMLQKISLLSDDQDLIPPKCFQKIHDKYLKMHFENIFHKGKRYLINLHDISQIIHQKIENNTNNLITNHIKIKELYHNKNKQIVHTDCSTQWYVISTESEHNLYEITSYGMILFSIIEKTMVENIYMDNKEVVGVQNNMLLRFDKETKKWTKILYIDTKESNIYKLENILIICKKNMIIKANIDQIFNQQIKNEVMQIQKENFQFGHEELLQRIGKKTWLFMPNKDNFTIIETSENIAQGYFQKNIGLVRIKKFDPIHNETKQSIYYTNIKGMKLVISNTEIDQIKYFTTLSIPHQSDLVCEPSDNYLIIRESINFSILEKIACPIIADDSILYATKAGILCKTNDHVYLLNR